jgi:tetratricopeptide (TPR) repeat protein
MPAVTTALGAKLGAPRGPLPTAETCAAALGYNAWEEWQIGSAIKEQTSKPPFRDQIDHSLRQARSEGRLKDRAATFTAADLQRAKEIALAAIARRPSDWQLHSSFGSMSFLTGDFAAALPHLEKVVEAFPQYLPPRLMLGNCLVKLGRPREAAEQFKTCLRVDPQFRPATQALTALGSPSH